MTILAAAVAVLLSAAQDSAIPATQSWPPPKSLHRGAKASPVALVAAAVPATPPGAPLPPPRFQARAPLQASRRSPSMYPLGLRAGVLVSRTGLGAGPFAALEGSPLLPGLDRRLRAVGSVGFASLSSRSAKLIAGRGYDSGFIQTSRIVSLEVGLAFDALIADSGLPDVVMELGYGLFPTFSTFTAFNQASTDRAIGNAVFGGARASWPIAGGHFFLDTRYAEAHANVGPLGSVGTGNLSGFFFTTGYAIDL